MNIFVLDTDPQICASYHCDKHVVKMALETAQLLCTALTLNGAENVPYKKTHAGNKCTLWAAESRGNFDWLLQLGFWLCYEYSARYGKKHKCEEVIQFCSANRNFIKEGPMTDFAFHCPEEYKTENPVETCRNFYRVEKASFARYKFSQVPDWMLN